MAGFGAVLDACVLVPISLADTLLRLAERDVYRPVWSEAILAEVRRAVLEVHPDIDPGRVDARLRSMNAAFEDACVEGWEPLSDGIELPDPQDRHVVAAAIRGRAELIVTANLVDFPDTSLSPLGLHALSPDDFLLDALDLSPRAMLDALASQAADTRRPPLELPQLVDTLERAGAPRFAAGVRAVL